MYILYALGICYKNSKAAGGEMRTDILGLLSQCIGNSAEQGDAFLGTKRYTVPGVIRYRKICQRQ